MNHHKFFKIFVSIGILVVVFVIVGGLIYAQTTWVGPTGAPPTQNVAAPINVGGGLQTKFADSNSETPDGIIAFDGNIKSINGCFGSTFLGSSSDSSIGSVLHSGTSKIRYAGANQFCADTFPGSRVCKSSEIIESLSCGVIDPTTSLNGGNPMWVFNLAPSLPTATNDCLGWFTTSGKGIVYIQDPPGTLGGYAASCNTAYKFACCR